MGKDNIFKGIGRLSQLVMKRGQGSYVYTECGRKLLDFTTGIGVVNTGHCHPRVVQAAQEQCGTLIHGQVNIAYHDKMLELSDRLVESAPRGLDSIFFVNSGAEAVENSIKLARAATGKQNVIVMQGGYHGRSFATMSMTTSSRIYRQNFGPLLPGIFSTPFPYEYHGITSDNAMQSLDTLFKQVLHEDEVAALIIEPVLGEGGYVPCPPDFLRRLQTFCKEKKILLICDEVQTGFGRTGSLFACDSDFYGHVSPDILVIAKGIASGFPLSAVMTRKELSDKQPPGTMGGTYTGNAVACAAALATQDVIRDEKLVENSAKQGKYLKARLQEMQAQYPHLIGDVRGLGCMIGLEFTKDVAAGTKAKISQHCLDKGMLILGCSIYETMRFIPPLTVNESEINQGLEIFESAIKQI